MSQDLWGHDRFARYRPLLPTFERADHSVPLRIALLVGNTDISGGTYVILQHAMHLMDRGHDVTLIPFFPHTRESRSWHPAYERLRVAMADEVSDASFDVAIATWWRTVYELWKVRALHHAYFVQSIESRFYGQDELEVRRLADDTFGFGLPTITIASWLQWFLAVEHRCPSVIVRNGIEKTAYHPTGPAFATREPDRLRVLVEGHVDVPMKNVPRTVELVREAGADEVWLLTPSDVEHHPGVDRVFSRVPITATAGVYRSCDVLVKLSFVEGMFGPPLEMFHCGGTTICWDVTGHEEYVRSGENGLVVSMGDEESVVKAVRALAEDVPLRRRLQRGALETAAVWPSWPESSSSFADAIEVFGRLPARDAGELLARSERGHRRLR